MINERLDLLTSISGEKIETVEDWEKYRRPELMVLLENFTYGVRPADKPEKVEFRERFRRPAPEGLNAEYREVVVTVNDVHSFVIYVFIPNDAKKPVPAFIEIANETRAKRYNFHLQLDYPHIPVSDFINRGYALVVCPTNAVSPDWYHHGDFCEGVFRAMQPDVSKRKDNSWATISAWSLGASLAMDYIEKVEEIDSSNVGVAGHSRDGKAALWAAATDKRFKLVVSNCSGCGGAAYTRGKKGEHLKNINVSDWFCDNYRKYNEREEMMPFDQHMLLATIAPRPLYVKSAVEDEWADPEAELLSAKLVSKVYELYGLDGLIIDDEVEIDKAYIDGTVAYHCATGDHDMTRYDWKCYLDFADKHLKK